MSISARDWAWEQPVGTLRKLVLLYLAERADGDGTCWPTLDAIMAATGMARATIVHHLAALETGGLLTRRHRGGTGTGRASNVYRLNLAQHAKFNSDTQGGGLSSIDVVAKFNSGGGLSSIDDTPYIVPAHRQLEPSVEPSLESTSSPSLPLVALETPTRARRVQAKTGDAKPFDEEAVTAALIAEYAGLWTPEQVRERIGRALNHKASTKWLNRERGVRDWLRRDATEVRGTSPPHRNGTVPVPPGDFSNGQQEPAYLRAKVFSLDSPDDPFAPLLAPKTKGLPP